MKILITGTAGFIGYHLSQYLCARGYDVVGLDNINDYYDVRIKYGRLEMCGIPMSSIGYGRMIPSRKHSNYRFYRLDLQDRERINKLFKEEQLDSVCNLAAQAGVRYSLENPYAYIESNISGFFNILDACRVHGIKNFSYASSSSVYGLNKTLPFSTSDNVDHPMSLYAASKKSNELMAHSYSHLFEIPTTGLRFFSVYGPWGRPDMALFLFTKAILEDRPIDVYNNGNMMRDFTYIDDIVEGVVRVIENPASVDPEWNSVDPNPATSSSPYRIYNIGNSSPVQLMEFIEAIEKKLGKKAIKNFLPMQAGDVPAAWADTTDLEKNLSYKPSTTIEDGVSAFIDWYLEFYK